MFKKIFLLLQCLLLQTLIQAPADTYTPDLEIISAKQLNASAKKPTKKSSITTKVIVFLGVFAAIFALTLASRNNNQSPSNGNNNSINGNLPNSNNDLPFVGRRNQHLNRREPLLAHFFEPRTRPTYEPFPDIEPLRNYEPLPLFQPYIPPYNPIRTNYNYYNPGHNTTGLTFKKDTPLEVSDEDLSKLENVKLTEDEKKDKTSEEQEALLIDKKKKLFLSKQTEDFKEGDENPSCPICIEEICNKDASGNWVWSREVIVPKCGCGEKGNVLCAQCVQNCNTTAYKPLGDWEDGYHAAKPHRCPTCNTDNAF